ncbi:MAG: DUF1275 domain-containing protein [Methylotenera sp.]|nr:DUF1275 domain-containing protein [Oligoflexia bacterium]
MFRHSIRDTFSWKDACHWFLLSFLSGNVNVGGYLACNRFVSHVTGFATLAGVDAAHGRFDAAIGILSVPIFFLLGVMISASLIDRRDHRGQRPQYALVMGLVALCLFVAALAGHFELFGKFGGELRLKRDYFFLALLCMASGLQNAAVTTSSGSTIRTTHLTGLTTDLGIGLVKAFTFRKKHTVLTAEMRSNYTRIGTFLSFMAGSLVGAVLFLKVEYLGFLLPMSLALYAMGVAYATRPRAVSRVQGLPSLK